MTRNAVINVEPDLLNEAELLGIDVRQAVDVALRSRIEKRKKEIAWQEENKVEIGSYNRHIERDGLWHERLKES